jgi:replicative DNA helicase
MIALFSDGHPIDYHSVGDRLVQLGLYEASGGLLYLSELSLATPTAAHIEYYGKIVERTAIMRELIENAQTITEIAWRDNLDPDVALEKAERLIMSVAEKRVTRDFRSLEDVLTEYMEQIEALAEGEATRYGIPTGFMDLDKLLGGFQRTDLIILAARTSVGKTSFALNLAVNAAVKHNATVAISLEWRRTVGFAVVEHEVVEYYNTIGAAQRAGIAQAGCGDESPAKASISRTTPSFRSWNCAPRRADWPPSTAWT